MQETADSGSIPGSGRSPGGGNDNSLQYFCLDNSMDRGACGDYHPWGRKKSDTTENACGHSQLFITI